MPTSTDYNNPDRAILYHNGNVDTMEVKWTTKIEL